MEEQDADRRRLETSHDRIEQLRRDLKALARLERSAPAKKHDAVDGKAPVILNSGKPRDGA